MDDAAQAWFEEQRRAHYPPALNRIPAHLTMFHSLPGTRETEYMLRETAARTPPFRTNVTGVLSMGRGVLYSLKSPELEALHRALAANFVTYLTPQDKQPLRPHVVVQNKVEPQEAKRLLAQLTEQFAPRVVEATGLLWWEYLGGPWRALKHFPFRDQMVETSS